MSFGSGERKPRGRSKSLVQASAVRRMVEREFNWPDRKPLPRNFWRNLNKSVRRETGKQLGEDQGTFL